MASSVSTTYGARPVSMDLMRGRLLTEPSAPPESANRVLLTRARATDQLALAHWPSGHAVVVCGLDGGTGRSTVASLFAASLAELPWAHVHKPVALVELRPRELSTTRRRWMAEAATSTDPSRGGVDQYRAQRTRSGIAVPVLSGGLAHRNTYSVVVMEAPVGLPSQHDVVRQDARASVLLVVRPDRRSLAEAADALVWMHDQRLVHRCRVVVVVNLAAGEVDRGSRASSTALAVRCRAIHKLPYSTRLGPLACLPSGTALAPALRQPITDICLDVWRSSQDSQVRAQQEEA